METSKKTMLAAVFAVAVIAFAGVGYAAAVGYKATTTITTNSIASSEYITIAPATEAYTAVFTGAYAFDTVNAGGTVTFPVCYEADGDTISPGSTKFTYQQGAYTLDAQGTLSSFMIAEIVLHIDFSHAASATGANLVISSDNAVVPGNGIIGLVFTVATPTANEAAYTFGTNINTVKTTAEDVTLRAYLVVDNTGVQMSALNTIAIGNLPVNTTLTFVATTV